MLYYFIRASFIYPHVTYIPSGAFSVNIKGSKLSKGFSTFSCTTVVPSAASELFSFTFFWTFNSGSFGLPFLLTLVLVSFSSNSYESLIASTIWLSWLTPSFFILLHFRIRLSGKYPPSDLRIWSWKNSSYDRF